MLCLHSTGLGDVCELPDRHLYHRRGWTGSGVEQRNPSRVRRHGVHPRGECRLVLHNHRHDRVINVRVEPDRAGSAERGGHRTCPHVVVGAVGGGTPPVYLDLVQRQVENDVGVLVAAAGTFGRKPSDRRRSCSPGGSLAPGT